MKRFRGLVGILLLLTAAGADAAPRTLTSIRYYTAPDHTRIVADLSGPSTFTHRVLGGPDRIAVDIKETRFRSNTRKIAVDDGLVRAIRMNVLRNGTAQVVLDLVRPSRFQVFALAPVAGKPDRVVIDVYREVKAPPPPVAADDGVRRIVIDPGHGGDDPGAAGLFKLREKDLTLDLARRLARLTDAAPGYEALLTRKGDYFVKLRDRQVFARREGADLFISLHANSARSARPNGFEIFFLSLGGATDKMARELADKENASDLVGGVPSDAEDEVLSILFDYLTEEGMKKSEVLAEELYNAFRAEKGMAVRNVKQAGFAVLKSIEVPAVLVEVGFLSNRSDAALLADDGFRDRLVHRLFEGIENYYARAGQETVVFHVVKRGETAWSIAEKYCVNVRDLLDRNGLRPDSMLEVGQRLRIP
ncbi:MAG: N-acetylmuramoyl-L-alanine amidase [Candidatus Eisenbacteria bacterium]